MGLFTSQRVSSLIPDSSSQHKEMPLGKKLDPKLDLMH